LGDEVEQVPNASLTLAAGSQAGWLVSKDCIMTTFERYRAYFVLVGPFVPVAGPNGATRALPYYDIHRPHRDSNRGLRSRILSPIAGAGASHDSVAVDEPPTRGRLAR